MDHRPPLCFECIHYLGNLTCEAFPMGIPDEILTGRVLEVKTYPERVEEVDCEFFPSNQK